MICSRWVSFDQWVVGWAVKSTPHGGYDPQRTIPLDKRILNEVNRTQDYVLM